MINASTETVRAVSSALQLISLLDDRAPRPDKPRIAAWAEQIERHRLAESDLLDGVQAFYDSPCDHAISVGDLIHHARHVKRSRLEAEADVVRDERRAGLDAKAADGMEAIAGAVITGPTTKRTKRLKAAERALQCSVDKDTAKAAIREYFSAKAAAKKGK